jgi:hypothetical protein
MILLTLLLLLLLLLTHHELFAYPVRQVQTATQTNLIITLKTRLTATIYLIVVGGIDSLFVEDARVLGLEI